jgi:hypothetical protein
MYRKNTLWSVLIFALLLCACAGNASTAPAQDVNTVLTFGVETLVASVFQTQTAMWTPAVESIAPAIVPSEPPVATLLVATSTPIYYAVVQSAGTPSQTPSPTGTYYTATVDPALLAYGCYNLALIRDISIPDGEVLRPGENFTKTWKVANSGTCQWLYKYKLAFLSGDKMGGEPRGIGKVIPEGKWTELSLSLKAPDSTRTYTGYWRFADPDGNMFGATLSVSIKVGIPTDTPAPTSTPTATPTPTLSPTSTFTATTEPPVSYPNN